MIKGDYDKLMSLAWGNVCSEHHTPLEVAWYSPEKVYVLRCGEDHYPDAITRQLSLTEGYKAGEELPGHIEDNVKKGMRRRQMQQPKQPTAVTMGGVPAVDLGSGELLLPHIVGELINYARRYGLDPARGHVVMMYGRPYFTIDGYLYIANRSGIPYKLESWPMSKPERENCQVADGDHAWKARVVTEDGQGSVTGLGIVTLEEIEARSTKNPQRLRAPVVAKHPQLQAQKRAEWQALRRRFPIGESSEVNKEEVENDKYVTGDG